MRSFYSSGMSARDAILTEVEHLPESVLQEALHFIRFVARQREDAEWQDILPSREVEQEVLDLIDAP
ncbi:MAG: hypothetical protein QOE70_2856 [Chthoniobacter sp.]|jgi:hypothetical protein|nr:hypothetical protein [Chthoniobacter sp.]